jgi:hypothetical protein
LLAPTKAGGQRRGGGRYRQAVGGAEYYTRELATDHEQYLSSHGQSPGRWYGAGASALGLEGEASVAGSRPCSRAGTPRLVSCWAVPMDAARCRPLTWCCGRPRASPSSLRSSGCRVNRIPCGPCRVGAKRARVPGFVGEGEADRGDDAVEDLEADGIVIGAQLFLSARTVEWHLRKGVHRARRQLSPAASGCAVRFRLARRERLIRVDLAPSGSSLGDGRRRRGLPGPAAARDAGLSAPGTAARLTWAGGQVAGGWARWRDRRGGADPDHSAGTASTAAATA